MTLASTCGEAIIRLLEAYDVDMVFGIPGVHTLELYRGLAGSRIRHIMSRHEQGAGFMADGYARVSGRPGVCLLIAGPGVTNAATPMGQAYADSVPLLVISSENRVESLGKGWGELHEISDQQALIRPITDYSATVQHADEVPQHLASAFAALASRRPRPAHIAVPIDVLSQPVEQTWRAQTPPARPTPQGKDIAAAARLLAAAERPVIVAGGGALDAGAGLQRIAESLAAPIVTTIAAKGVVPESHTLSLGTSLMLPATQEWLSAADIILAIGTELSEPDFMADRLTLTEHMIRVDLDPAKLTDVYPAEIGIVADAKRAADAIADSLATPARDPAAVAESIAGLRQHNAMPSPRAPAEHFVVLDALRRAVPADGIVMTDMTRLAYTGNHAFPCDHPRKWFHPVGYGALGYALPAAVGASLAAPESPVVALTGDLGFLFSVQELATAAELSLPLVILLWNDQGLGAIRRNMSLYNVPPIATDMRNPDFQALAASFGCRAVRPASVEELVDSISEGFDCDRPTVVEVTPDAAFLD